MSSPAHSEAHAKYLASRVLSSLAGGISASLDSFSGWLLSGFGAAYALLLTNIEAVSAHISLPALKCGFKVFLISVLVAVVARYLGAVVVAGAAAAESAAILTEKLMADGAEPDINILMQEIERAIFWPQRKIASWSFSRVASGDLAFAGRLHAKLSQVHAFLVLLVIALILASSGVLLSGLAA